MKAIPKDVVEQETYYVVEILDSGDYYGEVKLDHNFISQVQIVRRRHPGTRHLLRREDGQRLPLQRDHRRV